MSLLKNFTTRQPKVVKTLRNSCHDYVGAYGYFQDRINEMAKALEKTENPEEAMKKYNWVAEDKDGWYVQFNLHSMPVYWEMEPVEDADGKQIVKPIFNPDGSEREMRPLYLGHTKLNVGSQDEGIQLLIQLSENEDEGFKEVLTRAAEALQIVDEVELPHINQKAEMLYNAKAKNVETYGRWDEKDAKSDTRAEGVYSAKKTNLMNQAKQTARRQLGYARAKVQETVRKTY